MWTHLWLPSANAPLKNFHQGIQEGTEMDCGVLEY